MTGRVRYRCISSSPSISRPRSGRARCKAGARLDNEVELAERLGLSRPTVRAAFVYLANKGMVTRKRGRGDAGRQGADRPRCRADQPVRRPGSGRAGADDAGDQERGRARQRARGPRAQAARPGAGDLPGADQAGRRRADRAHAQLPAGRRWSTCAARCSPSTGSTSCCAPPASGSARRPSACRPRTPRRPRRKVLERGQGRRAADHGADRVRRQRPSGRVRPAPVPRVQVRVHDDDARRRRWGRRLSRREQEVLAVPSSARSTTAPRSTPEE